ncbi:MAG: glycosyltransferase family A protein [Pseudomonadales bacterium]
MTHQVSISFIIPTYNDASHLPRSIGSILDQLQGEDELIIVDDGSTDDTASVVSALTQRVATQTRYQFQHNRGVSAARNAGIALVETSHIWFIDADDELLPNAIERMKTALLNGAGLVIGGHEWIRGESVARLPAFTSDRRKNFELYLTKKVHLGNLSCMCFRRDVFEKVRFDERLRVSEDWVLLLLTLATTDVATLDNTTTRVHRRDDSLRSSLTVQDLMQQEKAPFEILFDHPALPQDFAAYRTVADTNHQKSILRAVWKQQRQLYTRVYANLVGGRLNILFSKWTLRYVYQLFRKGLGRSGQ